MKNPDAHPAGTRTESLLLFTDNGRMLALPSLQVLEILYPHPVTPLPFVPACIDGLINVEGRIAVQLHLARLAGEPMPTPRSELLLVETGRTLCALKVDAVLSREADAPFEPDILPADDPLATLVNGRTRWNGIAIPVLAPAALGRLVRPEAVEETGSGLIGSGLDDQSGTDDHTLQCLVAIASDTRYALPLQQVVEIVEAEPCMALPGTSDTVDGMLLLREQVLLVADLAGRLGQPRRRAVGTGWYIVIDHPEGHCAFAVDEILEIEHLNRALFQPASDSQGLVDGVFALPGANTVLLKPGELVNEELAALLARHHQAARLRQATTETEASQRFLEVLLAGTPYAVPADTVKRILPAFPFEVTDDPSGRLRGAIELEGKVIPVLALEYGLALPSPVQDREYVIVGDETQDWAIGVDAVQRIVSVPVSQVNRLRRQDARYVGGVAHIDGQLVSTLDFSQLAGTAPTEEATP